MTDQLLPLEAKINVLIGHLEISRGDYIGSSMRSAIAHEIAGAFDKILKNTSALEPIIQALGWQGGTIHQVIDEVKRLKARANE